MGSKDRLLQPAKAIENTIEGLEDARRIASDLTGALLGYRSCRIHKQDAQVIGFSTQEEMTEFVLEEKRNDVVNYIKPIKIPYQVIYLNGASSSGKSTLAKTLQEKSHLPFLHVGIDKLIEMMPSKMNDWAGGSAQDGFSWKKSIDKSGATIQEIQAGPFAQKLVSTLKELVVTLVRLGHFIIIDDIAFGEEEVKLWRQALKEYNVLLVGLFAQTSELEERERKRGDRIIGSAREQNARVHNGVVYDLELDSSRESTEDMATKILERLG